MNQERLVRSVTVRVAWLRLLMGAWLVVGTVASAQTVTSVFNFDSTNGESPAVPVQGLDGKLYGTANQAGGAGFGTVYRIGTGGSGGAISP